MRVWKTVLRLALWITLPRSTSRIMHIYFLFVGLAVIQQLVDTVHTFVNVAQKQPAIYCNTHTDTSTCDLKSTMLMYVWNDTQKGFTQKGTDAILHIFNDIDEDKSKYWDREELSKFGERTNGQAFEDEDIQAFFNQYCPASSKLNFSQFAVFFASQTVSNPSESAHDLSKFGYDPQLRWVAPWNPLWFNQKELGEDEEEETTEVTEDADTDAESDAEGEELCPEAEE